MANTRNTCRIDRHGAGERCLQLAATGMPVRQIAATLAAETPGLRGLSHNAVAEYLQVHRAETAEAVQAVHTAVQAELIGEALDDVQLLQEIRDMAMDALRSVPPEARASPAWAAVAAQARQVIEARLRAAGASEQGEAQEITVVFRRQEGQE